MSSPYINRFLQPDTIIPDPANPQSWNRFSYVLNNPIRFNDPSGNKYCDSEESGDCKRLSNSIEDTLRKYRVRLKGDGWNSHVNEQLAVIDAVEITGIKFASERGFGESSSQAFGAIYGHITMQWEDGAGTCGKDDSVESGGCTDGSHQIRFWSLSGHRQNDMARMIKNVVHEIGHAYYNSFDIAPALGRSFNRAALRSNPYEGRWDWQQHPPSMNADGKDIPTELFADTFIAWIYDAWNTSSDRKVEKAVDAARDAMNYLVPRLK